MVHPLSTPNPGPARRLAPAPDPVSHGFPVVLQTSGPGATIEPELSVRAAAAAVGTSPHLLAKIREAQYLPDFSRAALAPLIAAPFVSTAERVLPVVQTAPAEAVHQGWRIYAGDAPWLADLEWEAASRGDWRGAPTEAVLQAGVLCVGLGGLLTGVLQVTGVDHTPGVEQGRVRYEAEWLARLDGPVGSGVRFHPSATPTERSWASTVVGCRFVGKQGGAVTLI